MLISERLRTTAQTVTVLTERSEDSGPLNKNTIVVFKGTTIIHSFVYHVSFYDHA